MHLRTTESGAQVPLVRYVMNTNYNQPDSDHTYSRHKGGALEMFCIHPASLQLVYCTSSVYMNAVEKLVAFRYAQARHPRPASRHTHRQLTHGPWPGLKASRVASKNVKSLAHIKTQGSLWSTRCELSAAEPSACQL